LYEIKRILQGMSLIEKETSNLNSKFQKLDISLDISKVIKDTKEDMRSAIEKRHKKSIIDSLLGFIRKLTNDSGKEEKESENLKKILRRGKGEIDEFI
jgi:hypothetical protein